jgi:hypothetical protein
VYSLNYTSTTLRIHNEEKGTKKVGYHWSETPHVPLLHTAVRKRCKKPPTRRVRRAEFLPCAVEIQRYKSDDVKTTAFR